MGRKLILTLCSMAILSCGDEGNPSVPNPYIPPSIDDLPRVPVRMLWKIHNRCLRPANVSLFEFDLQTNAKKELTTFTTSFYDPKAVAASMSLPHDPEDYTLPNDPTIQAITVACMQRDDICYGAWRSGENLYEVQKDGTTILVPYVEQEIKWGCGKDCVNPRPPNPRTSGTLLVCHTCVENDIKSKMLNCGE